MKKKFVIVLLVMLIISCYGCCKKDNKTENNKSITSKDNIEKKKDNYKDLNNTPIGIYQLKGKNLNKLYIFNTKLEVEKDINTFQIYPSNEESIVLNTLFGQSFYNEWIKYNNIKMGFNIKFSLVSGENISYNILSPTNTFEKWQYLMNYLYDDYANLGRVFYSHIENDQYNDSTLFTAIKMQCGYYLTDINSKIQLTVFTYDSDDDFLNGEYRGNSSYTLNICIEGIEC